MTKRKKPIGLNDPLYHPDHARPRTRREFIAQGFLSGAATVVGGSMFSLLGGPRRARADLSMDVAEAYDALCAAAGGGKIPFICFDLAGGANIAGSNVLIGGAGGQEDFLSTAGYSKQGLPGDRTPANSQTNFINQELGLKFHSQSAMLSGILEKVSVGNRANINGAVIPARSQNDTANNPHNPMYAIKLAGAGGSVVDLIGSRNSDSGGNSMAPADFMAAVGAEARPTKVDRPSDVVGLVDTGSNESSPLRPTDTVAAMESMYRLSDQKLGVVSTGLTAAGADAEVERLVRCAYLKSTWLADRFGGDNTVDPATDANIVGPTGIFSAAEFENDGEFRKTASVMKMVVPPNGLQASAGAGTITMGGYDYHTGDRETGERRDLRVGRCIGACLEYASIMATPVMIYVCSDGSVFSNGMIDNSADGAGKGVWTGDNQQTAASFFLVYNPLGPPTLRGGTPEQQFRHQQLGYMRASGDVETASTPAANNVNLLVQTVLLNYMALHGEEGDFTGLLQPYGIPNGLGDATQRDSLIAFQSLI
ncbi:MAG: hypothetical protein WDZ30_07010 [Cellvibrionaceae bacterium]